MESFRTANTKPPNPPKYHNPPPVIVPRSQYANTIRSDTVRSRSGNYVPRNFSSPFRAPLNPQDRHDSFLEHQRSVSNIQHPENSLPRPRYPQELERSSYTFFEPQALKGSLSHPQKSHSASSGHDKSNEGSESSQDQPGIVRQASIGHKAKPALLEVKRSDSSRASKPYTEPKTPPPRASTIEALSNAIAAAIRNPANEPTRHPISRASSDSRMPFDSPTSSYSHDFHKSRLASSNVGIEIGRISPLEQKSSITGPPDPGSLSPLPDPTPHSEKSASSINPLLGLGIEHQNMSNRIPEAMRPPKLNIKAVREMEARGSITSLPDLIRRATRLAANLDRGKTASRLGIWDMFGNTDHGNMRRRESMCSDVLDAFPDPASNTPSKRPSPGTTYPVTYDDETPVSRKRRPKYEKPKRSCCGLSVTAFITLLIVIIVLIAAAVLIPIFLVAVPRENAASSVDLKNCQASFSCQNNGISVVDNNACSCICVDGFTGSDCSREADSNCVTSSFSDGSQTYENATIGNQVKSVLEVQGKMNIPLNVSALLSVFAINNLSCASENSLVQFDTTRRRRDKRLFIIATAASSHRPIPTTVLSSHSSPMESGAADALELRQAPAQTSNAIIFEATSTRSPTTDTASRTSASASTTATPATNVTTDQLRFAQLVVLYVLAESRVPSTAVVAQQNIAQYFRAGALASGNSTVEVVDMKDNKVTANFAQLAIVLKDGKVVGSSGLHG